MMVLEKKHLSRPADREQKRYPYDETKTIPDLFDAVARQQPAGLALIWKEQSMTYKELQEQVDRMAHFLRRMGIGRLSLAGILVRRSPELLIAIMAILKSGAAYVPIDPAYPGSRRQAIIENSRLDCLITERALDTDTCFAGKKIYLDDRADWEKEDGHCLSINNSRDLAYIIYTSGSTGVPKGVMIEHRAVHNLILAFRQVMNFAPLQKILFLASISFDMSVAETLVPLLTGLTIVIAGEEEQKNPAALHRKILDYKIEILEMTPSNCKLLLAYDKSLQCLAQAKTLIIGGEMFPGSLLTILHSAAKARIYNAYGPTEATVWCTAGELTPGKSITAGKPFINTTVSILDGAMQPVAAGEPGELYIGGDCLARGYLHQEQLTAERFICDDTTNGQRLYKTGDVACWTEDGEVVLLGRSDDQVKINGYRIELGDIETHLLQIPGVCDAAVIPFCSSAEGSQYLYAFVVPEKPGAAPAPELKAYLKKKLPEYMVPAAFQELPALPLNNNRKVDRKQLKQLVAFPGTRPGVQAAGSNPQADNKLFAAVKTLMQTVFAGNPHIIDQLPLLKEEDPVMNTGFNSIDFIRLVTALEQEYGVIFNEENLATGESDTFQNLLDYLKANSPRLAGSI